MVGLHSIQNAIKMNQRIAYTGILFSLCFLDHKRRSMIGILVWDLGFKIDLRTARAEWK